VLQLHALDAHGCGDRGLRCDHGHARAVPRHGNARGNVDARVHGCGRVSVRAYEPHPRAGVHGRVRGCARENASARVHVFLSWSSLLS